MSDDTHAPAATGFSVWHRANRPYRWRLILSRQREADALLAALGRGLCGDVTVLPAGLDPNAGQRPPGPGRAR
jgi:hypothetical protein